MTLLKWSGIGSACVAVLLTATSAQRSLAAGYHRAYMTESVAGGVNILPTLLAAVEGIWRFAANRQVTRE